MNKGKFVASSVLLFSTLIGAQAASAQADLHISTTPSSSTETVSHAGLLPLPGYKQVTKNLVLDESFYLPTTNYYFSGLPVLKFEPDYKNKRTKVTAIDRTWQAVELIDHDNKVQYSINVSWF
ncbi:hypothetical protein ACFCP7_08720 [Paenibacillus elgii]